MRGIQGIRKFKLGAKRLSEMGTNRKQFWSKKFETLGEAIE